MTNLQIKIAICSAVCIVLLLGGWLAETQRVRSLAGMQTYGFYSSKTSSADSIHAEPFRPREYVRLIKRTLPVQEEQIRRHR